jgi:hypothetical protein
MGHLPIVTQKTMEYVISEGNISTRGSLKKFLIKTTSDIFSDVLAARKGDLIFPWIVHDESGDNIGFKYVFKVAGPAFFVLGDKYPVKIPLENEGIEFENPLSEAEALDLWDRKLLWNAIGKKSLGRGRSLTHQTPMEDEKMLDLLRKKNIHTQKKIILGHKSFNGNLIHINSSQDKWDGLLFDKLNATNEEDRLSIMELSGVPWKKGTTFAVEKTLEAWMMEHLDKKECDHLRGLLFSNEDIEWFGNYLPFGVQGGNLDIVILHSKNNKKTLTVIELKVGALNEIQFESAFDQAVEYSIFLKRAFNSFDIDVELNPIVLSGNSKNIFQLNNTHLKDFQKKWITYKIDNNGIVTFTKVF